MPRPGWDVVLQDAPVPRSLPTDTGVAFFVGTTEKGPQVPVNVRSLTAYEEVFGARVGGAALYDAVDAYFREGGSKLYVSANPTTPDAGGLLFGPSGQKVAAPEGEGKQAKSKGKAEAKDAPEQQDLVSDPLLIAAIDAIPAALGPGQLVIPGETSPAIHAAALEHAIKTNRIALLDAAGATAAALVTEADGLRTAQGTAPADPHGLRFGALFGSKAVIPGVTPGTTRLVGWAAIAAGIIARQDAASGNPNIAAAGVNGTSVYALALETQFTDDEYETLNSEGVIMAQYRWGQIQTYGYVTLVDRTVDALWWWLGGSRVVMGVVAAAGEVAERYVFSQIDGQGLRINEFGGDLRAAVVPFYDEGALYGETAQEAFQVEVGPGVNSPQSIANGELHAVIQLRTSPGAEYVEVTIVKVATTEALAAAA